MTLLSFRRTAAIGLPKGDQESAGRTRARMKVTFPKSQDSMDQTGIEPGSSNPWPNSLSTGSHCSPKITLGEVLWLEKVQEISLLCKARNKRGERLKFGKRYRVGALFFILNSGSTSYICAKVDGTIIFCVTKIVNNPLGP